MGGFRMAVPLAIQIGAVVALFAAALGTLWYTSSAVVEREERRARANDRLKEASDQLEARGKDALASVRQFPGFMEVGDWSALDRSQPINPLFMGFCRYFTNSCADFPRLSWGHSAHTSRASFVPRQCGNVASQEL